MLTVMIDVALGLILLYLILSVIASALMEAGGYLLQSRARTLKTFITEVLAPDRQQPNSPVDKFYAHPLVKSYAWTLQGIERPPDYVAPANFVSAILDLVWSDHPLDADLKAWEEKIKTTPMSDTLRKMLLTALEQTEGKFENFRTGIETWFNGAMDQVSRAYKRNVQVVLFAIGLVLALGLNIDTIMITSRLLQDPVLRGSLVQLSDRLAQQGNIDDEATKQAIAEIEKEISALNLPIGWSPNPALILEEKANGPDWWAQRSTISQIEWHFQRLVGLFVTALAVSQGAPFWFDLLKRVTQIRQSTDSKDNDK